MPLPDICPTLIDILGPMKNRVFDHRTRSAEEIIATFGEAQLVKVDGRIQLRGGSMAERAEALEWVALFMPGEVVALSQ